MTATPQCYGKMFPTLIAVEKNRTAKGKVFSYRVEAPGIAITRRTVGCDNDAWQQCLRCGDFEGCYRLSAGKLMLERALQ